MAEPRGKTREERATVMAPVKERLGETDFYISYYNNKIYDEDSLFELDSWVNQIVVGLIVVDPLHAAHSGRSLTEFSLISTRFTRAEMVGTRVHA